MLSYAGTHGPQPPNNVSVKAGHGRPPLLASAPAATIMVFAAGPEWDMKRVMAIVIGLPIALAACSSGNSSPNPQASSSSEPSATPAATGSPVLLGGSLSAQCQQVQTVLSGLGAGFGNGTAFGTDPSAYFHNARDAFRQMADRAPSGTVRDAFNTIADDYNDLATALNGVRVSAGSPPPIAILSAALQIFSRPGYAQAISTITTWITTNCTSR